MKKILAAIVSVLVVVFAIYFSVDRVRGSLRNRNQQIEAASRDIAKKELTVHSGEIAMEQLDQIRRRSLPANRERARSLYQSWLLERVDDVGLAEANVKAGSGRPHRDYYQHSFSISGRGNLEQLTELLYEFYFVDFLHRIRSARFTPIRDTDDLDINIQVDVLSMTTADDVEQLVEIRSTRLNGTLDDYKHSILNRNIFGPANQEPKLASIRRQDAKLDQRFSYEVRATEKDERQRLRYSLVKPILDGMQIDSRSGRLEWTPRKLGEFPVAVRVEDNGLPPKHDDKEFTIRVEEPDPPTVAATKPEFDVAKYTFVTAIIENSGRRQCWIDVRPEGRVLKLNEGDKIQVGTIDGVVQRITGNRIEIKLAESQFVVVLGKSLVAVESPELD